MGCWFYSPLHRRWSATPVTHIYLFYSISGTSVPVSSHSISRNASFLFSYFTHNLITEPLKLHVNSFTTQWKYIFTKLYQHFMHRVLTTSPNASALYRVLQAPGLGKNEVFNKEKNKYISDGFQTQSQSSSAADRGSRIHSLTQKLTFKMKSADELLIAGCCSWEVYSCLTWSMLLTSEYVERSLQKRMNLIMWPAV